MADRGNKLRLVLAVWICWGVNLHLGAQSSDLLPEAITSAFSEVRGLRTTEPGEFMLRIADAAYGNKSLWPFIWVFNRVDYPDPERIPRGASLVVPQLLSGLEDPQTQKALDQAYLLVYEQYRSLPQRTVEQRRWVLQEAGKLGINISSEEWQARVDSSDLAWAGIHVKVAAPQTVAAALPPPPAPVMKEPEKQISFLERVLSGTPLPVTEIEGWINSLEGSPEKSKVLDALRKAAEGTGPVPQVGLSLAFFQKRDKKDREEYDWLVKTREFSEKRPEIVFNMVFVNERIRELSLKIFGTGQMTLVPKVQETALESLAIPASVQLSLAQIVEKAEAIATDADVKQLDLLLQDAEKRKNLDGLVLSLEKAVAEKGPAPALLYALSLAYGRLGLIDKSYRTVEAITRTPLPPGVRFNLTLAYGRKDLLERMVDNGVMTLRVKTDPPGAQVRIDGQAAGTSPLKVEGLRAGSHQVEIFRLMYRPKLLTVSAGAGQEGNVDVKLDSLRAGTTGENAPGDQNESRETLVKVQMMHSGRILTGTLNPTGTLLATGGTEGAIKVWETSTLRELRTMTAHTGEITSLAFSPDGRFLASASRDATVRIWNYEKGQEVALLTGHRKSVAGVAFSPDSRTVATAGEDQRVILWDTFSGKQRSLLTGPVLGLTSLTYGRDSSRVYATSQDGKVYSWDAQSGRMLESTTIQKVVNHLAYSPTEDKLLGSTFEGLAVADLTGSLKLRGLGAGALGKSPVLAFSMASRAPVGMEYMQTSQDVAVWDVKGLTALRKIKLPEAPGIILPLPDGKSFVATYQNRIKLHDTATLQILASSTDNLLPGISGAVISENGLQGAWALDAQSLVIADFENEGTLKVLPISDGVGALLFPTGKKTLLVGTGKGALWEVDPASGRKIGEAGLFSTAVTSLATSSLVPAVLAIGAGGEVHLVESVGGKTGSLPRRGSPITQGVLDSQGLYAALVRMDERIEIWDLEEVKQVNLLPRHPAEITALSFSQDGTRLFVGDEKGAVVTYSTEASSLSQTGSAGREVGAFSGIRARKAPLSLERVRNTDIRLINTENQRTIIEFKGSSVMVTGMALSPDGQTIVVSDVYGVYGFEASSGKKIWFTPMETDVRGLDFNEDGSRVVVWEFNGRLHLLNAVSGQPGLYSPLLEDVLSVFIAPRNSDLEVVFSQDPGRAVPLNLEFPKPRIWTGHRAAVTDLKSSPEGVLLISSSRDNQIRFWDQETGKLERTIRSHFDAVNSLSVASGSDRMISASSDGTIQLWNADKAEPLAVLMAMDAGNLRLYWTPEGYFTGSEELIGNLMGILDGTSLFPISPFRGTYYRPDVVSARLRGADIMPLIRK